MTQKPAPHTVVCRGHVPCHIDCRQPGKQEEATVSPTLYDVWQAQRPEHLKVILQLTFTMLLQRQHDTDNLSGTTQKTFNLRMAQQGSCPQQELLWHNALLARQTNSGAPWNTAARS